MIFVVTTRPVHTFPQSTWGIEHGRFTSIEEAEKFAASLEVDDLTLIDVKEIDLSPLNC